MDRYTSTARERWQMRQSEPQPQGWVLALFAWIFTAQGFVEGLIRGYNEHYQSGR
ncbi:hypothetical protein [Paenibacillus sp. 23TSA30-6]|uniref:hypothetical protein n=1 Tax=Paenibacillus sp. 23TSA30-6 TaxID=2546104 RepID=UPI00178849F2|nr:hypothetical protein [Paenibacillus sp. 23TSA30-6]